MVPALLTQCGRWLAFIGLAGKPSAGREAKFAGHALPIAETVSYYTELKPGIERHLAMGVATRCGWKLMT